NRQPLAPRPECMPIAPLLPLLRAQALGADEYAAVQGHLSTCAWCHNQLAAFDLVDAGLRRTFSVAADAPPFLSMEAIMGVAPASDAELRDTSPPPSRSPRNVTRRLDRSRGLLSGVGALAAALLIAVLAATIFRLHGTPHGSSGPPTPTPELPLAQLNVYLAARSEVVALHAANGSTRWQAPIAPAIADAIVAVNGGVMYAWGLLQGEACPGGAQGGVYGFDGRVGDEVW